MQDFRKLRVRKLSQGAADQIYKITGTFPPEHLNGLTSQLRRASDSISSNIAEECGRATKKERAHFLHIALGSANEVDNCVIRARRLGLAKDPIHDAIQQQVIDVRKMLVSLINRVKGRD